MGRLSTDGCHNQRMGSELPDPPPASPAPDGESPEPGPSPDVREVFSDADLTSVADLEEDTRSSEKTARLERVRRPLDELDEA
jgi:hypothetical protein